MEKQRTGRSKSPIHIHATRNTPVHVHVKKKKKKPVSREIPGIPTAVESRLSQRQSSGIGSSLSTEKSTNMRMKSKPRATPTFIPPPGRTSSGKSMLWEDEEVAHKENMYEERINSLMGEVGVLRNELSLQKTSRDLEKKDEQLNASRRVLEEQEDEILGYKSELDTTIRENEKLRQSMEKYKNVMEQSRSEVENIEGEKELLLSKLVEVEMDGRAAAEEVGKLRDTIRKLKHDKKLTASDVSTLTHQREVLMQKLEGFETTNRTLRKILKQAHLKEGEVNHITEQRDVLLRKLTEAESKIEGLTVDVTSKDRQVETLLSQVEGDKEQARMFEELHKTMEATRAHLQNQLRNKEGETFRLSNRLRETEQELERRTVEVEHLEGLLNSTREKATKDKEALKKATRMHRDRASKNEEAVNAIRDDLIVKTEELENLLAELDAYKEKFNRSYRDKASLDAQLLEARGQLQSLDEIMASLDLGGSKPSHDSLPAKLKCKLQELNSCKFENESLKDEIVKLSEKFTSLERTSATKIGASHADVTRLQSAVDQYETLIAEFKSQVDRYRKENDELNEKIYQKEKEMKKQLHQVSNDNETALTKLEKRISELEPYPNLLKSSEARLRDAQDCVSSYESRTAEHTKLIAELTQKVESQAEQLERVREKYQDKHDESKQLQMRLDAAERKLEDSESYRKEVASTVNKRDESIHILQERLDEQRHENTRLVQQLETALADAKRQADVQREKALSKERTTQARILDLESQLSRSATTAQQLKRAKEEAEHKFNSRLQDMRDRLEQANSSTRSMQNYVSFLKSTYASVFNDSNDSALSSPKLY